MRYQDQWWIYDTYKCSVYNDKGSDEMTIYFRRACMSSIMHNILICEDHFPLRHLMLSDSVLKCAARTK